MVQSNLDKAEYKLYKSVLKVLHCFRGICNLLDGTRNCWSALAFESFYIVFSTALETF